MILFRNSGIEQELEQSLEGDCFQYYLYSDPAYVLRPYLQVGFKGASLMAEQEDFKTEMSMVRIAVEWAIKDIKKYFTHVDFSRKLCPQNTPAGLLYLVSTIRWNFRSCLQ